jgi:hypothetical protein
MHFSYLHLSLAYYAMCWTSTLDLMRLITLVRSIHHKLPCYAVFFSLLLFPLSNQNILMSIPFSNIQKTEAENLSQIVSNFYHNYNGPLLDKVLPLKHETKFYNHAGQMINITMCYIFIIKPSHSRQKA